MNDSQPLAGYFCSSSGLWRWVDNGQALVIDGLQLDTSQTVAFHPELLALGRRLENWPAFPAIIGVLSFYKSADLLNQFVRRYLASVKFKKLDPKLSDLLSELRTDGSGYAALMQLSEQTRRNAQFKTDFVVAVCQRLRPVLNRKESRQALQTIGQRVIDVEIESPLDRFAWSVSDIVQFLLALQAVDPQGIADRMATGVSGGLPHAAQVDIPTFAESRVFLKSLQSHPQLSRLGAIAESMLSLTTLPRRLSDRSKAEMGGFSDLTNRGSLDRLMVSELAYDDLTLAIRVAMNEAMYLQREQPPGARRKQRLLLLDCGIRTWGMPRLFATAVGLALSVCNEENTQVLAFRAEAENCLPVDIYRRDSLIEHLQAFTYDLHPGAALRELKRMAVDHQIGSEPVLVMEETELADPEFIRCWQDSGIGTILVATVNRQGDFQLSRFGTDGLQTIRKSSIPLAEIVAADDVKELQTTNNDLPAIFSLSRFPLRLNYVVKSDAVCKTGYGLLGVSNDRRLMLNESRSTGAIELTRHLPLGKPTLVVDPHTETAAIILDHQGKVSVLFFHGEENLSEPETWSLPEAVQGYFYHRNNLVAVTDDELLIFNREDQTLLSFRRYLGDCNSTRFIQGRTTGRWTAWSPSERYGQQTFLPLPESIDARKILGFVETPHRDGQIGILKDGTIVDTAAEKAVRFEAEHEISKLWYSSDRSRAYVATDRGRRYLIDSRLPIDQCCRSTYASSLEALEDVSKFYYDHGIRNRLKCVGLTEQEQLIFLTPKGEGLVLSCDGEYLILESCGQTKTTEIAHSRTFENRVVPFGFCLAVASWQGQDQKAKAEIYLDSRGLIHCRSSRLHTSEITFVLKKGRISGWIESGEVFGESFFQHSDSIKTTAEQVYQDIIKPLIEVICD